MVYIANIQLFASTNIDIFSVLFNCFNAHFFVFDSNSQFPSRGSS